MKVKKAFLLLSIMSLLPLYSCDSESYEDVSNKPDFLSTIQPGDKLSFVGTHNTKKIFDRNGNYIAETYAYYIPENSNYLYYLETSVNHVKLIEVSFFSNCYVEDWVGVAELRDNEWYYLGTVENYYNLED